MWVLRYPDRLKAEIAAVETLQAETEWLQDVRRRVSSDLQLSFDCTINVNGEALPFTLAYPESFPETPPSVKPSDGRHYSTHQWGAGGEFCLEYRSDNWDPSITGAMMLESTYRLLSGERPAPDLRAVVPSAHDISVGQSMRSAYCRCLATRSLMSFIGTMPEGVITPCRLAETSSHSKSYTSFVTSIGFAKEPSWAEREIPFRDAQVTDGVLVRVASFKDVPTSTKDDIDKIIASARIDERASANDNKTVSFFVLSDGQELRVRLVYPHKDDWNVIAYRTIDLTKDTGARLPDAYADLARKIVGLVGCGSLGSKIAVSLARSGVKGFVLVDDDILKPGNLQRNELDAESIGAHKVEALATRMRAVGADLRIETFRIALGGQESSGTTAVALDKLSDCDLLIDASADPQAFNFVAAGATRMRHPMIWSEVYAGGIGGFLARVRPDREPPPHIARRQYHGWCRAQGVPWTGLDRYYGAQRGEAPPLIADDADVGVIAAHTARMAIDTLVGREPSAFPHPAYAIGLASDWIFEEPFVTKPIDFTAEGSWPQQMTKEQIVESVQYLSSIIGGSGDESLTGT